LGLAIKLIVTIFALEASKIIALQRLFSRKSAIRIRIKHALEQGQLLSLQPLIHRLGIVNRASLVEPNKSLNIRALEQSFARQVYMQHGANPKDVRLGSIGPGGVPEHGGVDVSRSAGQLIGGQPLLDSESQVCDHEPVVRHKHIVRLDVPVDDAHPVQEAQPREHVPEDDPDLAAGHSLLQVGPAYQAALLVVLRYQPHAAEVRVGLAVLYYVRVGQSPGQRRLLY
jgi:hypothetical protein